MVCIYAGGKTKARQKELEEWDMMVTRIMVMIHNSYLSQTLQWLHNFIPKWCLLLKKGSCKRHQGLKTDNGKKNQKCVIMVTRSSLAQPWHPWNLDITDPQLVLLKPHAYILVHGWHLFPVLVAHHVADYSLCPGLDFLCLPRWIPFGHHPSVLRHPSSSQPSPRNAKEGQNIHI